MLSHVYKSQGFYAGWKNMEIDFSHFSTEKRKESIKKIYEMKYKIHNF